MASLNQHDQAPSTNIPKKDVSPSSSALNVNQGRAIPETTSSDTGGAAAALAQQPLSAQQLTGEETAPVLSNSRDPSNERTSEEAISVQTNQANQLTQDTTADINNAQLQKNLLNQDQKSDVNVNSQNQSFNPD